MLWGRWRSVGGGGDLPPHLPPCLTRFQALLCPSYDHLQRWGVTKAPGGTGPALTAAPHPSALSLLRAHQSVGAASGCMRPGLHLGNPGGASHLLRLSLASPSSGRGLVPAASLLCWVEGGCRGGLEGPLVRVQLVPGLHWFVSSPAGFVSQLLEEDFARSER